MTKDFPKDLLLKAYLDLFSVVVQIGVNTPSCNPFTKQAKEKASFHIQRSVNCLAQQECVATFQDVVWFSAKLVSANGYDQTYTVLSSTEIGIDIGNAEVELIGTCCLTCSDSNIRILSNK